MKKQQTITICDDCGVETGSSTIINGMDFCWSCLSDRVVHSFRIKPNRKCENCEGKGNLKEFYYHNEYNMTQCPDCKGKGIVSLWR